jgi:integrase
MRSNLKLTDKFARAASTERQQEIVYDAEVRGFGLRLTRAGAKSWILNYRTRAGVERRFTIGSFPAWPAAKARARASELRQIVDRGGDPLGEVQEQRAAPTVADLCAVYFVSERFVRKGPYSREQERNLTQQWIAPELARRKAADITRADIEKLHRKVTDYGTPTRANRLRSLLSVMFILAVRQGWRADNPVIGVERNREHPRARYLTVNEIGRLLAALAEHRKRRADLADILELLLLTGARRGEVLNIKWSDVDLDRAIWTKPHTGTKQRRQHRVPLSPEAIELLRRQLPGSRADRIIALRPAECVFPIGDISKSKLNRIWAAICRAAGLEGVRLHDLRHSYASLLVSNGRSLPEIGALLGHSQVSTTARYAHLFDEPLRAATSLVGEIVRGAKRGGGVDGQ